MREESNENVISLSTLLDFLPGMAYRCLNDESWTMHYISRGCHELTGYNAEDLIENKRLTYNDLIHPDDRDKVRKAVEVALEKKIPYQMEYRIVTAEGDKKWVWEQGYTIPCKNEGDREELHGLILDISRIKEAEEAVRESENFYRTTMNHMSDAFIITDPDGRFSFISGNINIIFGYSAEEVQSMEDISQLFGKDFIKPSNLKKEEEIENIEVKIKDKKGIEHFLLVNIKSINLRGGKYLYTCRDITERKRMEEELIRGEERFRNALDNLLDACAIYLSIRNDKGEIIDFRIEYINNAACMENRMPKEKQVGKNLCQLFPEHLQNGLFEEYCRLVKSGLHLIKDQFIYEDGSGKETYNKVFDIRANKFEDGVIVSWRDVTEKKNYLEKLARHVDELERFQKATVQREFRLKALRDENEKLKNIIEKVQAPPVESNTRSQNKSP